MRKIEIDGEVWEALKKQAKPLEDTPNSVLRRLVGLAVKGRRRRTKPAKHTKTREYRRPILKVLEEMGGSGRVNEVLKRVFTKVRSKLREADLKMLPAGGDVRWHNAAQWERYHMIKDGLLRGDSPRGIWQITEKGRQYLQRHRN